MKKKKRKIFSKKSAIGVILGMNILLFLLISPENNSTQKNVLPDNMVKIESQNPLPTAINTHQRAPASISKMKTHSKIIANLFKDREVIGAQKVPNKIVYTNRYNQKWKDTYGHHFLRMVGDNKVKDFKIHKKRSVIKIKNNTGTLLEHIVVSYKKENGAPFSFEALVNSETGIAVQTWNQTKYEHKTRFSVKGKASDFSYQSP